MTFCTIFVVTLMLTAGCAGPVTHYRRCGGTSAREDTLISIEYRHEPIPGARVNLVDTDYGTQWNVDADLAGTVRLKLPPGSYRIWARLGPLYDEGRFEVTVGCATTVVLRLKYHEPAPDA